MLERQYAPVAASPRSTQTLDAVHREHVWNVLVACHGNQTTAARVLGMDRKTLSRRIRRWGLHAAVLSLGKP